MRYKIVVLLISAAVALLIHFPELMSLVDRSDSMSPFVNMSFADIANEVGYLFLSLLLLFWLNTVIFKFNNPSVKIGWPRLLFSFFVTWGFNSILAQTFIQLHEWFNIPAIDATLHHYLHPLRDFIISCVVTGGSYIIHLVAKQHKIMLENQQLRTENLRNQYETLKNQLNPHMFFNSLNTLSSLIRESPTKAQHYTQELSKVLRYTLQPSELHGVTLSQEMEFVNGYIFLLKTRYEENLDFQIEISSAAYEKRLPPMAIQMLIENAVKHNEISRRRPLVITICTLGDSFVTVSNPIQRKISHTQTTGIGLNNLSKRYQLLYKTDIEIVTLNDTYCVKLPIV